jgi:hypothetical protein
MKREEEMELAERLYEILSKEDRVSLSQLSNELGVSKHRLLEIADYISSLAKSKRVYISRRRDVLKLADKDFSSDEYIPVDEKLRIFRVGLASETHIGSAYSSASLLGSNNTCWRSLCR